MRVFLAAIVVASLAGPAFAQQKPIPKYGELEGKADHEIKAEKEAERAYQKSLRRIPEQKGTNDPWGSMRSEPPPKAVAKDPKRAKAAGTAK
ncbi:MAG: hypothetical protein ABIL01_24890 [Pseudomonadota bacterium]